MQHVLPNTTPDYRFHIPSRPNKQRRHIRTAPRPPNLRLATISTTKGDVDMKTWFITGASRGFGRVSAEAALKRGDKVTATARKLADIVDLKERFGDAVLPLVLDVTDPE
jgi:hypothetical protein